MSIVNPLSILPIPMLSFNASTTRAFINYSHELISLVNTVCNNYCSSGGLFFLFTLATFFTPFCFAFFFFSVNVHGE